MTRLRPTTLLALSLLTVVYLALPPAAAAAPVTLYTTRAAFNAASLNTTMISFEGIAANNTLAGYNTAAGLTLNGVNFVGGYTGRTSNFLYVAGQGYSFTGNSVLLGPPSYDTSLNTDGFIRATLAPNTTSVGLDVLSNYNASSLYITGMNISVTTSDNVTQTFTISGVDRTARFAGFSVLTPGVTITSLRFSSLYNPQTGQRNYPVLDNFAFGQALTPVPEPATLVLLGTGLFGASMTARRRRKASPPSDM